MTQPAALTQCTLLLFSTEQVRALTEANQALGAYASELSTQVEPAATGGGSSWLAQPAKQQACRCRCSRGFTMVVTGLVVGLDAHFISSMQT